MFWLNLKQRRQQKKWGNLHFGVRSRICMRVMWCDYCDLCSKLTSVSQLLRAVCFRKGFHRVSYQPKRMHECGENISHGHGKVGLNRRQRWGKCERGKTGKMTDAQEVETFVHLVNIIQTLRSKKKTSKDKGKHFVLQLRNIYSLRMCWKYLQNIWKWFKCLLKKKKKLSNMEPAVHINTYMTLIAFACAMHSDTRDIKYQVNTEEEN